MQHYRVLHLQGCARHTPLGHLNLDLAGLQVAVANLAVQVDKVSAVPILITMCCDSVEDVQMRGICFAAKLKLTLV